MKKLSLIVSILREEFATFSFYTSSPCLLLFGFAKLAFGARDLKHTLMKETLHLLKRESYDVSLII